MVGFLAADHYFANDAPTRVLDVMARTGTAHPSLRFAAVNRAMNLNEKPPAYFH